MADISEYRVGLILAVSEADGSSKKAGKSLKVCSIDMGAGGADPITVVTSAPNVREGSRVAVAPVGSTVMTEEGDELQITKTVVGGVASEGMLCDSRMLGWSGGAAGIAVQIPDSIPLGSPPPSSKPRMGGGGGGGDDTPAVPTGPVADGLFAPKLSKEEKKKLAAEKRAAKKAAKEATKEDS